MTALTSSTGSDTNTSTTLVPQKRPQYQFDQAIHSTFIGKAKSDTFVYAGRVDQSWAVGQVPAVSYVIAMSLNAVIQHYSSRFQNDPIALNTFFFRPCKGGPFTVEIRDLKTSSKGYCIVEAILRQPENLNEPVPTDIDQLSANWVVKTHSILTMGNMDAEKGVTFIHTPWSEKPPSFQAMEPNIADFMSEYVELYQDMSTFPPVMGGETPGKPEVHHCVGFRDGRTIDYPSLAYYSDMFIHPNYSLGEKILGGRRWNPTMQLEIQFKRRPAADMKRVLGSFRVPHIINNRFDLDGALFDMDGQLLAITRHQCLLVPWDRNTPPSKL
ncbi:thioesterase-like superfamily-domain-containing protein [Dichotomocladium elegans]|nr:thioesterase-like superfamily-domain-containing protein [Dichotomocladium elegans]